MVNLRQAGLKRRIKLTLTGPKSILPSSVEVEATLRSTWYELLKDEVGLQITRESGLFVCTSRYSRNTPDTPEDGKQRQWCANLDDQIIDFVEKFERKRTAYCVRLAVSNPKSWNSQTSIPATPRKRRAPKTPTGPPSRKPNIVIPIQTAVPTSSFRFPTPEVGNRKRRIVNHTEEVEPVSKQLMKLQQRKQNQSQASGSRSTGVRQQDTTTNGLRIINTRSVVKIEPVTQPEPEPDWASNWDEEPSANQYAGDQDAGGDGNQDEVSDSGHEDDDNLSMCTAAEETELRRQGIPVDDAKSLATGKFARFSNAYMLRVRNEMRKLQRNHTWDRCVSRTPLACYFVQELFKD